MYFSYFSGQQVLGPSKRKAVNEIVQDMFKAVKTYAIYQKLSQITFYFH